MKIEGNGNNRFYMVVKCEHEVYDPEWGALLFLLNDFLQKWDKGKFSNVGVFLEEVEEEST